MGTDLLERPDTDERIDVGEKDPAHIIRQAGGDGGAKLMEAMLNGTPVEALCGEIFVPSRDPENRPVCQPCKEERNRLQGKTDEE